MKTTVVPAQITSVEDKIAGSLSVSQLILLAVPIFCGSALFVALPPFFSYAVYKVVLIVCLAALCAVLAIRIKGKIILSWAFILLRYNLRPRHYLFDKNDAYLRGINHSGEPEETTSEAKPQEIEVIPLPSLKTADLVVTEDLVANPAANLRLEVNRKGELRVRFTEVR